jgi:hypothetical protein
MVAGYTRTHIRYNILVSRKQRYPTVLWSWIIQLSLYLHVQSAAQKVQEAGSAESLDVS